MGRPGRNQAKNQRPNETGISCDRDRKPLQREQCQSGGCTGTFLSFDWLLPRRTGGNEPPRFAKIPSATTLQNSSHWWSCPVSGSEAVFKTTFLPRSSHAHNPTEQDGPNSLTRDKQELCFYCHCFRQTLKCNFI